MNLNQKLQQLVEAYPEKKAQLLKYFQFETEALGAFVLAVDECDFPLGEWIDALDTMTEWLSKRGQVMSLSDKLQYLNCATEIMTQGAHWENFASAIREILERYGCEHASDS